MKLRDRLKKARFTYISRQIEADRMTAEMFDELKKAVKKRDKRMKKEESRKL